MAAITGFVAATAIAMSSATAQQTTEWMHAVRQTGGNGGIVVVAGLSAETNAASVIELALQTQWLVYFQSDQAVAVHAVKRMASAAGLLGRRVFADQSPMGQLNLADEIADVAINNTGRSDDTLDAELARVLHAGGLRCRRDQLWKKPPTEGTDDWSHPYHGPDNNPRSMDKLAVAPYATQFIAPPIRTPMPAVTVASGGRLFRAYGHLGGDSSRTFVNTLVAMNAHNGCILWTVPLSPGFMIHRAGFIATPQELFIADDQGCHVLDAATGRKKRDLSVPDDTAGDDRVWKWMALEKGTLYALIGGAEIQVQADPKPKVSPSQEMSIGGWVWKVWDGFDYKDPQTNFGFGRTLVAMDPVNGNIQWSLKYPTWIDGRAVCLVAGNLYYYSPQQFLACADTARGRELWKTSDATLLSAIGNDSKSHDATTGFASTMYLIGDRQRLYFAGPQRPNFVVVSAADGKLLWQRKGGSRHLILDGDQFYSTGAQSIGVGSQLLRTEDGTVVGTLFGRGDCARMTAGVDSLFYRGDVFSRASATYRWDMNNRKAYSMPAMRPPCTDGVIISDGRLHWGSWGCGCPRTFLGHVCLRGVKTDPNTIGNGDLLSRLRTTESDSHGNDKRVVARPDDWPAWGGGNDHNVVTSMKLPQDWKRGWTFIPPISYRPSGPVAVGGLVFLGDESGTVRALDTATGKVRWESDEPSGDIPFPPAFDAGRLYVGSLDGRVYAFDAGSGHRLWDFRVATNRRWLPVYGRLISNWPVAGGVVAQNGLVYAVAGLADHDGLYVTALDGATGKVKWMNSETGKCSPQRTDGVSLTGYVSLTGGELQFGGGPVFARSRLDATTGQWLNLPKENSKPYPAIAFYPYFPAGHDQYQTIHLVLSDGRILDQTVGRGSSFGPLGLLSATPPGSKLPPGWRILFNKPAAESLPKVLWVLPKSYRINACVTDGTTILAAGKDLDGAPAKGIVLAVNVADGQILWRDELPTAPVKAALAVDHDRRMFVALTDGQVIQYQTKETEK